MDYATDARYLGYEQLVSEVATLVSSYPPPFLYINDPTAPRITASVVASVLASLADDTTTSGPPPKVHYASVNAVACFSARLLYDSILNALAKWDVKWDDGCANWNMGGEAQRWNENLDGFVHGLQALHTHLCSEGSSSSRRKGKQKESGPLGGVAGEDVRLVIVVERVERLADNLPGLLVPLTRLAELAQLDVTVIFISEVRWEDIRPPLGASPDPYFIDVPPPTKETIGRRLVAKFPATGPDAGPSLHHPVLRPLYAHFVSVLCDVCFPFTNDPQELEYIAAARWPGFVQPVLDEHQRKVEASRQDGLGRDDSHSENEEGLDIALSAPSEDVRMRLSRMFNPSLTAAMEALYPRLTSASEWARANQPEHDILARHPGQLTKIDGAKVVRDSSDDGLSVLPRMSKFILVAAFLASTNPAKSDVRMFGRGLDEKKRKRRAMKPSVGSKSGPAKIPQRLVGPMPFPLDRLIAILGALLEENDAEARLSAPREYTIPGEYTDMEMSRVGVYAAIMELASVRLLHRTSNPDRIDGPPTFKCGVSYDVALALARQLDVPLNDLMWDPA